MAGINNFLALVLQLSVPLVLGALCGTIAERGGIILLGVEGMMLLGAFAGTAGSYFTGSAFAVAQAARFYLTDLAIPSQIVQMLPYIITLLILLFVGKRVKGPEALGKLVD